MHKQLSQLHVCSLNTWHSVECVDIIAIQCGSDWGVAMVVLNSTGYKTTVIVHDHDIDYA